MQGLSCWDKKRPLFNFLKNVDVYCWWSSLKRNIVASYFPLAAWARPVWGGLGGFVEQHHPRRHQNTQDRYATHEETLLCHFYHFNLFLVKMCSNISSQTRNLPTLKSVIIKSSFRHNGPQGLLVWGAHNEEAPSSKVIIVLKLIVVGDVALLDWWHNFLALLENMKNTDFFAV